MNKISKALANYIISKGIVGEDDRDVYEYGFIVALEMGVFALCCLLITAYLTMPVEGMLFFVVFTPLRSYAGGLHLKSFGSCLILSCLTYLVILLVIINFRIPLGISFLLLLLLMVTVYRMYPVENINRKVDEAENRYFKSKLRQSLFLDLLMAAVCIIFKRDRYLLEIAMIFLVVTMTMLIAKILGYKKET